MRQKMRRTGFARALVLGSFTMAILSSASMSLVACSGKSVDESDPASLYKDAESDISSDHYQIAIDKLRIIRNKFPYSKYSVDAQLRIADVFYLQENWAEAAATYQSFRDLHPKHEKVPYAMFRAAKSFYNDIPGTVARDMTPGYKALEAYTDFLKRFPEAPEAADARKDVVTVREQLAGKELYVADFYYKRDFYDSSRPRYQKIVDSYPETEAAKKAQAKLAVLPPAQPKQLPPDMKSESKNDAK